MENIRTEMAPLERRWKNAVDRKSNLKNALAELRKDDIGYIISDINAYEQWKRLLPKQAYENGYWSDTMEQGFKLMFTYKDEPGQDLIDFIGRYEAVTKRMRMGIFRHDLCRNGAWIVEKIDGEWVIYDVSSYTYKYQKQYEFKTKDLVEMLRYVSERHYYKGPQEDEDDDQY
ncbi:hypothetical protein D3C71_952550 [compost metagenome]